MSTQQPRPLRLANLIDGRSDDESDVAAELRRLHEVNAELLEAIQELLAARRQLSEESDGPWVHNRPSMETQRRVMLAYEKVHAAIAKATTI